MKYLISFFLGLMCLMPVMAEEKPVSVPQNQPSQSKPEKPQPEVNKIDLKTAYQREFAFLQSQKKELSRQLADFRNRSKADQNKLRSKVDQLERKSVNQAGQMQEKEEELKQLEIKISALEERSEVLNMTYQQAETSLKNYKIDLGLEQVFQTGTDEHKVSLIFNEASKLLTRLSSIQTRKGRFYLQDGKETEGDIIEIGNIASYGVSNQGSGALVPAGGEHMKIWSLDASASAQGFLKGNPPEKLEIFLYENRNKAIEEKQQKTVLSIIDSGGIVGWVIVSLGITGVLFILIRLFMLQANSASSHKIEEKIVNLVRAGKLDEAVQTCVQSSGAIARVMSSTLRHVKDDRDHMEDIIAEAILHESGALNKFHSSIMVIAAVSPLLGLLGTVTGMISTFDIITEFGTGDPKLLSSGISVALVTTELGLVVAIPTLLCGTLLASWSEVIQTHMERAALKITNIILSNPIPVDEMKPALRSL